MGQISYSGSSKTVVGNGQASGQNMRPRHGLRWQSAAATPLSHAPDVNEPLIIFVRAKAAWRSRLRCATARQAASRRTPKPRGMSRRYFEIRLQFYLNRSCALIWIYLA